MYMGMFKARVADSFSAAHRLSGYQGDCERLHGHNYRVEVSVQSNVLDEMGIVIDFRELKTILKKILEEMDHQYLNEIDIFKDKSPSAENIARHIHTCLKAALNDPVVVSEVVVWENDACCVTYTE